ncbi:hypothetical protein C8F04DRAFT_1350794 [Mycena alexandri]|uniref:Uncharacterized protein n=1 Tax=Mycena alexandri TaxID=1745969 RepID=A0AAD6XGN1_9AGAR|nr:hypothetical protein C8F04DRAFT_1350794 [Mycena alexandri]
MSLSGSGYFTRLTQACWSFFLSIFSSRRRRHLSLELPTSSPFAASYEVECDASGGLGSWQLDKQQFLRRPSLVRASTFREARKQRNRRSSIPLPPPKIYVEDWSSLGLNMTDLFETPSSAASHSGAVKPGDSSTGPTCVPGPEISAVREEEEEASVHSADNSSSSLESTVLQSSDIQAEPAVVPADLQDASDSNSEAESSVELNEEVPGDAPAVLESATLSFSAGHYPLNMMSAVSGLLWDPPSFSISYSTPLPDVATPPSKHRPQSTTLLTVKRDSLVPYPDLFDFSMYDRRVSQDSFYQVIELPPMAFPEPSDKKRPVSIYDVVLERDRYRGAAYSACISSSVRRSSSPRRQPLASTLNLALDSNVIRKKAETEDGDVGAQFLLACDELSRCEWTEEEFMTMFASLTV